MNLVNIPPTSAFFDSAHFGLANADHRRNLSLHSVFGMLCKKPTNLANLVGREFFRFAFPYEASMLLVSTLGHPLQIGKLVVGLISVNVVALHPFWSWAKESKRNNKVQPNALFGSSGGTEPHLSVSARVKRPASDSSGGCAFGRRNALQSSQTRNLIKSLITNDRAPQFFSHSHSPLELK